ncbi:expressed unknown protein [Seminavis robusta]|uniref:Transmembrane protein n=1 Tax=Seminavis robusta TaxID=568900 RepID=A0A9N8D646_9STRA|nr:expressed unknown protein [Seminavis robusta]|eukprot:Sro14_g010720.1 n/a (212) ;mRNA; r:123996-124705
MEPRNEEEINFVGEDQEMYRLLVNKDEGDEVSAQEGLLNRFKSYSILIGACCGIFVQLSTLGANFLLVAMWGDDVLAQRSPEGAMAFSLAWSFFTSCMALLVLALLRGMITTILDANSVMDGTPERDTLMMTVEVRYVVGALVGVCFAWTCTDLLLGMQSLAFYSLGTLVVALVWSRAMIWCFVTQSDDDAEEVTKDQQESDSATCGPHAV